jgi:hypothetical protein
MATGAAPGLESRPEKPEAEQTAAKPASLRERFLRKLIEIFEHNERMGTTRQ